MKKRNIIISVFLVTMMLVTMLVPAFAAFGDDCQCGKTPVIQVRGIGETLYVDGEEVFSTGNIISGILPVVPQLATFLTDTTQVDLFVDAAKQAVTTIFAPVMYNNNGERTNVVTVERSSDPVEDYMDYGFNPGSEQTLAYMLYQELGEDHSYYFTYDWTANPYDVADELATFVEEVKEKSGHSKVSICAESMGGAVVNAYLATHPLAVYDIENLVMSNSAFNGLEMIGQLFTGNTEIDGEKLAKLIEQEIMGNAEYEALIPSIPMLTELATMANDLMSDPYVSNRIYSEILIPVFGYIPSFWSLVPAGKYDAAESFMLKDAGVSYKSFVAGYQLTVVSGTSARYSTIQSTIAGGVNFYNVSNYNRYIAPVTPSANWNSDGVIETYNTSGFATVADMGETLGEGYTQAKNIDGINMISPDNVIDASTAQEPTQTWFIKNLGHVSYGMDDGTGDFYIWLLTGTGASYTIESNPDYPQFMYYDTSIPMLMTWEEKAEIDEEKGDGSVTIPEITLPSIPGVDMPEITIPEITIPEIPGFDTAGLLGALEGGLDSVLGGLGGTGGGGMDLGGIVDTVTGIGGMLGGMLGGLDIGGMLGGLMGGEEETPEEPEEPEEEPTTEAAPQEPTTQAPTQSAPTTNNNTNNQTTSTPVEVEGGNTSLWLAVVIATLAILGILVVVL